MKQFKGVVLKVRIEFIKRQGGQELLDKICRRLPAPYRELIEKSRWVLPGWYPWDFLETIQKAMVEEMAGGNLGVLKEVGRFGAEMNVKGVYRLVFLVASPEFLIPRAAAIWTQQFSNGEVFTKSLGPKKVNVQFKDFEGDSKQMDLIIQGWLQRVTELSGGKQVAVLAQKPSQAGVNLEYTVDWK